MSDFRGEYFLAQGASVPDFPPERFRLPDGSSRYSSNCSQEDLNSAGYEGPFPLPPLSGNETAAWDNSTKTWVIVAGGQKDPRFEDAQVRAYLVSVLDSVNETIFPDPSPQYLTVLDKIKSTALTLLDTNNLLTFNSLPKITFPALSTLSSIQRALDKNIGTNKDRFKYIYETYGFIGDLQPDLSPFFVPPSGWVQGSGTLENQTITIFPNGVANPIPYSPEDIAEAQASGWFVDPDAIKVLYPSGTVVISGYDPNYGVIISLNPRFF